jgi:hypothetical protein
MDIIEIALLAAVALSTLARAKQIKILARRIDGTEEAITALQIKSPVGRKRVIRDISVTGGM